MNGTAIRRARLRKGMNLRDVAAEFERLSDGECKLDASNLSRAERNKPGGIGARKIPLLAEILGLSIDELVPDQDGEAA